MKEVFEEIGAYEILREFELIVVKPNVVNDSLLDSLECTRPDRTAIEITPKEGNMIDLLRGRRSIRKFEKRSLEEDEIRLLEEALLRSPSSRSINPWEFIFVDDPEILEKLSRCKPHGAAFLAGAPLAVVIIGNTEKSDTCVEDCSIAAITLQYVAESLGLGSCWCQIRLRDHDENTSAEEYVRRLLGIPDNFLVECIIGLGYPAEKKTPHPAESLEWGKIRRNSF